MSEPLPDSRASRNRILDALRKGNGAATGAPVALPDLAPYLAGPYGKGCIGERPDPAALVPTFETAARGWRAEVVHADAATWPQAVRAALSRHRCERVVVGTPRRLQDGLPAALEQVRVTQFDRPLADWKAELFENVDAGITDTLAGVADTGTLVLSPGPQEPRTLSLVPPVHVALLRVSTLYASLPAAMRALAPQDDMPTNLLLVTGPSKTADIQQTLAFGAHGPKVIVIVVVHDLPAGAGAAT